MDSDHARRMLIEARRKIHDSEILAKSKDSQSDAQALIHILAFEILLKCAIRISGQKAPSNHNYPRLWLALPGYARKEILSSAEDRMPGYTDFSDVPKVLGWFQTVFEKGRYYYEFYEGYTLEEQKELGMFWRELGSPNDEADLQYFPNELFCLCEALAQYIESRLSNK